MDEHEKLVKDLLGDCYDLNMQAFDTVKDRALVVFIDGLVDKDLIDRDIIFPLKSENFNGNLDITIKTIFKKTQNIDEYINGILSGMTAVFYNGSKDVYLIEFRNWSQRNVEEPSAESVIRGSKEGFTENMRTNTSLIRRRIRSTNLTIENFTLGRQTNTQVELVYMKGIVNQDVLNEVRQKITQIDTDAILESGYIEQYITTNTFSPVSGIGITQKPDVCAARILEGRVAVLVDGTPHVLTIPDLFIENIHTAEDYYNKPIYTTTMRVLRLIALFITVVLPGLSIAILTHHAEMLPSIFFKKVISTTVKTPAPLALEALILIIMFELLREAGTRLPKAVGSAITIVGSLIIGDAAVSAGIVSEVMVIVVALTAVTSFMVPNLTEFVLIYRTLFWFLGSMIGIIGVGASFFIVYTQLASTESFGVPILSSFSKEELKDSIIKFPIRHYKYRPKSVTKDNVRRAR